MAADAGLMCCEGFGVCCVAVAAAAAAAVAAVVAVMVVVVVVVALMTLLPAAHNSFVVASAKRVGTRVAHL